MGNGVGIGVGAWSTGAGVSIATVGTITGDGDAGIPDEGQVKKRQLSKGLRIIKEPSEHSRVSVGQMPGGRKFLFLLVRNISTLLTRFMLLLPLAPLNCMCLLVLFEPVNPPSPFELLLVRGL